MGLSATFSVSESGSGNPSYQWFENGAAIPGATNSQYTTPPTKFSDSGEMYSVEVSDAAGSVTSNSATLTVTARAPQAGDLRFQQVDTASTINGYSVDVGSVDPVIFVGPPLGGGMALTYGKAFGTAYFVGNIPAWQFQPWDSDGSARLGVAYLDDYVSNFQSDLTQYNFPLPGVALNAPNIVINSVSFLAQTDPSDWWFALSCIQIAQGGGFDMTQHVVEPSAFQSAAAQDGANGRVITAVTYDGGQILYLSYGWQGNGSTTYDVQTVAATIATTATAVSNLAAQGYILTAIGQQQDTQDPESVLLVGTRVHGDTLPRPIQIVSLPSGIPGQLIQQGYAVVGVVQTAGNNTWIGER